MDREPTEAGSLRVLDDAGDCCRFFDATPQTEFLYGCVEQAIERDLPEEAGFPEIHGAFRAGLNRLVGMPERISDRLFRFLHQNGGRLSRRGRRRPSAALAGDGVPRTGEIYREAFGDPGE